MSRRTITIDQKLDAIINMVRGFFLLVGKDYNYTEVVNNAVFYGVCYWLNIDREKAVKLAPKVLSTNLKMEGMRDEQRDKMFENIFMKLQLENEENK